MLSAPVVIGLVLVAVATFLYQYHTKGVAEQDQEIRQERKRKENLKALVENRKVREDETLFDEENFWKIMANIQGRCRESYKNALGLFKDKLNHYSAEELLTIDNLIHSLNERFINYDIMAASEIILGLNTNSTIILMHALMIKGEVFYKNACISPNLIIDKKIEDIIPTNYHDIIAEVYYRKTGELIPELADNSPIEIPGEAWDQRDLPTRYSELWEAFA